MTEPWLSLAIIAGIVAILAFLAGRYLLPGARNSAEVAQQSGIEFARLQERERNLAGQVSRFETRIVELDRMAQLQALELAAAKEKLATNEEKIAGLERALLREKELGDSTQDKLGRDLADARRIRDSLQAELSEQSQKLAASERSETELRGQVKRAGDHITDRDAMLAALRASLEDTRAQLAARESALAAAAERESALTRTIAERDEQLKGLQEHLKVEFENIAHTVLSTATERLSERSQESLTTILDPLKTRIAEFQQKVESTHLEDTKQRFALGEQIRQVAQTNQSIGAQAENLTKALKGDSQLRGRWGEIRLERILEKSGLVRGREFIVQGGDLNIRGEDGGSLRPDVIILLPENRHFIVDSKLSLVDYLDYEAAESDELRAISLKKLLASIRSHIDSLTSKNYQHADAVNSHDLVLMFVPIEGVAALVLQNDEGAFDYAWNRRIVMVSPSTLFMAMQTVASVWRYEHQNQNARQIAEKAGQLYDKLAGIVGDLNDVSKQIENAANSHNQAMKKLSTGKGNALSRARQLKDLRVSTKKEFPAVLLSGERHVVGTEEEEADPPGLTVEDRRLLERPG